MSAARPRAAAPAEPRSSLASVLRHPVYARLFSAQVLALLGTGLLTVALGLLAVDLAGADAGAVLGIALTVKMVAYVLVSPVMAALVTRLPRTPVLVTADLVRAGVAAFLPFVTETWQVYLLILVLQSASATFTPAFQALIPSVLPEERDYTRALSLSRLAYDLEALVSPLLAVALLTVVSYHQLFVGTVLGFLASAALVLSTRLPAVAEAAPSPFLDRLTRGVRLFAARRELRVLAGLDLVVATATAMVLVNTAVLVQVGLGRPQTDVAVLLAAYGAGSMLVALAVPRLLDRVPDLPVMTAGAAVLPVLLAAAAAAIALDAPWALLLVLWLTTGAATSAVLTPSARVLARNADEAQRPAVYAAQFSLSHACFLVSYPVAGLVGSAAGLPAAALMLAALGAVGLAGALAAGRGALSRA